MKKLLSVFCMAILAGGMIFTSCTKNWTVTVKANNDAWGTVTGGGSYADQATATIAATPNSGYQFVKWDDGVKDNPRTITVTANVTYTAVFEEVPQNEAKITFQGTSWNAASAEGVDYTSENYITFTFFKVADSEENPYAMGFLECVPVSNATYQSTGGDIMHYRDPNYTFYDEDNLLGQGQVTYWGWNSISSTFVENITAVDLNALTISGNWTVEVGDVATYANTGDWGTTYPFTGNLTNATWTMVQPSSKDATKKVKNNNSLAIVK